MLAAVGLLFVAATATLAVGRASSTPTADPSSTVRAGGSIVPVSTPSVVRDGTDEDRDADDVDSHDVDGDHDADDVDKVDGDHDADDVDEHAGADRDSDHSSDHDADHADADHEAD